MDPSFPFSSQDNIYRYKEQSYIILVSMLIMLKLLIGKLWCGYTINIAVFFFVFVFCFFHQKGFKGYQRKKNKKSKEKQMYLYE